VRLGNSRLRKYDQRQVLPSLSVIPTMRWLRLPGARARTVSTANAARLTLATRD